MYRNFPELVQMTNSSFAFAFKLGYPNVVHPQKNLHRWTGNECVRISYHKEMNGNTEFVMKKSQSSNEHSTKYKHSTRNIHDATETHSALKQLFEKNPTCLTMNVYATVRNGNLVLGAPAFHNSCTFLCKNLLS